MKTKHRSEYASNLAGVALLAYDNYAAAKRDYNRQVDDLDGQYASGRMKAYSVIVEQATGRSPAFFQTRDELASFLGVSS